MRLLECHDEDIRLTRDLVGQVPNYAILSHTWGADGEEVTFRDMVDGTAKRKPGYDKIKFCATKALADGLHYFWVDTCCIDKANSTELIEAINSMFRWYQNADRCYVYLSDVSSSTLESCNPYELHFRDSRWLTRGWTLQELLAPSSVEFFTREGLRLGDKNDLEQQIHEVTGIAVAALQNKPLAHFTTEERFRWAANRNTTKDEDSAYCLLGIFGVYMPLIYGEGKKNAFRRLKKAITEAMDGENTPEPAQGKQTTRVKLSFLRVVALSKPSNVDSEIAHDLSDGKRAMPFHNYRFQEQENDTRLAQSGKRSRRSKSRPRKKWYCGWCDFGPNDWSQNTCCLKCKNPITDFCKVGYSTGTRKGKEDLRQIRKWEYNLAIASMDAEQ